MMIRDYVTARERLTFPKKPAELLVKFAGMTCLGCGRASEDIANEDDCNDSVFKKISRTTNNVNWYCHSDCFRDSH